MTTKSREIGASTVENGEVATVSGQVIGHALSPNQGALLGSERPARADGQRPDQVQRSGDRTVAVDTRGTSAQADVIPAQRGRIGLSCDHELRNPGTTATPKLLVTAVRRRGPTR